MPAVYTRYMRFHLGIMTRLLREVCEMEALMSAESVDVRWQAVVIVMQRSTTALNFPRLAMATGKLKFSEPQTDAAGCLRNASAEPSAFICANFEPDYCWFYHLTPETI